jgi:hypothetical protein
MLFGRKYGTVGMVRVVTRGQQSYEVKTAVGWLIAVHNYLLPHFNLVSQERKKR